MTPPLEVIYFGGQTWYFDFPDFGEKDIFWYTPTPNLHHNYIIF